MPEILTVLPFIQGLEGHLLLDVRSEKEFAHAHIPGAINIPLLNNEHRHEVGIVYKQEGREAAVIRGFELAGPLFASMIRKISSQRKSGKVFLYCWRGGMRSSIMAWLLELSGYRAVLLKGGYKAFRAAALESFSKSHNLIILGGKTGSGKTELLAHLTASGESCLDLESMANHRGSAFGALGMPAQPSNEHFENLLFMRLSSITGESLIWIENESRSIGSNKIPDAFYEQMRKSPVIEVNMSLSRRKQRILQEYGDFPDELLAECTTRLHKRLGGLNLNIALKALTENNKDLWLDVLMKYYDESYAYGMSQRESGLVKMLNVDDEESMTTVVPGLIALKNELTSKEFSDTRTLNNE
jgi:tRNA 2-selenouridine synthase